MDEALMKRVLPHSIEAEQSVIGSMLMDKEAIIAASEIVVAADFYQQQYGVMFESMVELFNEGLPVDLITLQNRLKEKDVPPEVSSLEFVRDIITTVPTSANVKSYANICLLYTSLKPFTACGFCGGALPCGVPFSDQKCAVPLCRGGDCDDWVDKGFADAGTWDCDAGAPGLLHDCFPCACGDSPGQWICEQMVSGFRGTGFGYGSLHLDRSGGAAS